MSRKITAAQKHQLMTKMLASQAGRKRIAASIQEPLRKLRDYQAICRTAMLLDDFLDTIPTPRYYSVSSLTSLSLSISTQRFL